MKKILFAAELTDTERAQLLAAAGDAECVFALPEEVTPEVTADVNAVVGNIAPALLEQAPKLEWVQLLSSGADVYAGCKALHDKFTLTTATGAYGTGIAEYMAAMLLVMMKKVPTYLEHQKQQVWRDAGAVASPMGKRVLIVGTGNLGSEFAARMRPFGCEIIGVRRRTGACPPNFDGIRTMDTLRDELPLADVVALCLPGTAETYHLFDAEMLALCKPGAYLMNVGRGTVIPTEALLDSAVTDRFAGVWVDVLETEPLPDGHPLFSVPNLLITPHITGGMHLDLTRQNIFDICAHNLNAWRKGEPLIRVLDWETGYCK